jgi:glucosylceramidase
MKLRRSPLLRPASATTIDFRTTEARFLRVVQTATAPQWWSVADLRAYR